MANPPYRTPSPDDQLTIICLHCNKPQQVSAKAQTLTCKFCYKPLRLKDILVKSYEARRVIETVGVVTVEKKGTIMADRVHCGGLVIRGKVKAAIDSRGPVRIGPEADVRGDVTAPSLAVGAGAVLEGQYQIGPPAPNDPAPDTR